MQYTYTLSKDSIKTDTNNIKILPNPKKAAILSACLPGLGQVYNYTFGVHRLWKLPIIYAGFGGLAYGFIWNQSYVLDYRDALRLRYDDDPLTVDQFPRYSDNDLVTLKNYYQRYRDLCVIGAAALYTLQILDATVDAHLASFDVSDNLTVKIVPGFYTCERSSITTVGLRFSFR